MWPEVQHALSTVATAIGAIVVAGGGAAVIGFGLFKWLGEKWLNSKFEERLAAYKHAQQKELEHLKFTINSLMDRTVKLHQREFDIIPEAWSRLVEAHNSVRSFTAAFQQYPDVERMNEFQLDEFLSSSFLTLNQRDELKKSAEKNRYYQKALFFHRLIKCKNDCREHHVYLLKNGIFMPESIKIKFNKMDDLIWKALLEYEIEEEHDMRPRDRTELKALSDKGGPLLVSLEDEIQKRLWSVQKIDNA